MRIKDGRVVPNFIDQVLNNKNLTVYGSGQQTRSFCFYSDLVDGIVRMIKSSHSGPVNLGNPDEFTILEFAKLVLKMAKNTKSKIVYKPLPVDDPKTRQPNISLAKKVLKWEPKVKLEQGLKVTFDWFDQRHQK
jgi:nucleoside-diphosphate-sugar epimerase